MRFASGKCVWYYFQSNRLNMQKLFLLLSFMVALSCIHAQELTGIATKWSDSFTEWVIFTDDEELEGELRLRWLSNNDWSEWEYRVGDASGSIRLKWKPNQNEWEVRGDNEIVTMRTVWNNDFREWRISADKTLTLKCRHGNLFDEWELDSSDFRIATVWEGDPRDWLIEDRLGDEVSLPVKMAVVFIAVFNSTPKM